MPISPYASTLNDILNAEHPSLLAALSKRGKSIYFPHAGILGQTAEAKGKSINATIGIAVGDDGAPLHLSSIANTIALPPASIFPYAPGFGLAALRSAWFAELVRKNPSLFASSFTLPVVTGGLTHSLSIAGYLFTDEGDDIIVPEPHWDNYGLLYEQTYGATLSTFPLFAKDGFNLDGLREHLRSHSGKQILLLNFPNNPTGYSPLRFEADDIVMILRESAEAGNTVIVLLDDAYFGLVHDEDVYPESLFSLLANLHERIIAVKIDGCSKEDYAWGLRVGFLTYGMKGLTKDVVRVLEDKTAGAVRATVSNACHLSQSLLLASLRDPSSARDRTHHADLLRRRYKKLKSLLEESSPNFRLLPCNSGYFLCVELADGIDVDRVRRLLLDEYGTGVIALGSLIRIAFSSVPESNMEQLVRNIREACSRASSFAS